MRFIRNVKSRIYSIPLLEQNGESFNVWSASIGINTAGRSCMKFNRDKKKRNSKGSISNLYLIVCKHITENDQTPYRHIHYQCFACQTVVVYVQHPQLYVLHISLIQNIILEEPQYQIILTLSEMFKENRFINLRLVRKVP